MTPGIVLYYNTAQCPVALLADCLLPSKLNTAINQATGLQQPQREQALNSILYSLRNEIDRELEQNSLDKCIIDTSPFFAGATQLAWYAADA